MSYDYDMRRITRVLLDWPASLTSADNTVLPVVIRNLSMNGAFVLAEETFPAGTEFTLLAEYLERPIEAKGVVVRDEPDGMALEFMAVEKEGLDNLVELLAEHADDPDAVRAEVLENWKLNIEIY